MPCYRPIEAFRGRKDKLGIRPIVWSRPKADPMMVDPKVMLPCGKCVGCRLEYARQWSLRCSQEASLHDENCFVTLTYDDDHLPEGGTLVKADFQGFMKRLRARYQGKEIRYFHSGEYGGVNGRPHYHALLFGHDFSDKSPWMRRGEHQTWRSAELEALWPQGMSELGSVTPESAGYVARYALKKLVVDAQDYGGRLPEYSTMSRRPGIGRPWYEKFKSDAYPSDFLISEGSRCRVPRYYDGLLKEENLPLYESMKRKRSTFGRKSKDNDVYRLAVREEVKIAQIKNLKRNLNNEN